ncbi:hypothetical protein FDECE_13699 [Fusarium decemcellulare]|nr:hypothetical protein FDECE_13699 [Fusarium decemcellulare]
MGGFVLKAPDLPRPIPLNAEQVFYLVQNRYIAYPETTLAELKDRDKSDGLARLVTVCQATWFVVNFIVRIVQGLFVTTMELTTVTFVVILFGTAWCWIDKPSDVTTTITVETLPRVTMDGIAFHGGPRASQPYHQTPLEFVSRDETALNLVWQYYNELVRKFLFSPFSRRVDKVPWDRVPGDVFLRMDFDLELIGVVFIFVFSSIFLAAWNFDFPTTIERDLWRASSIYMVAYGALGALWMELSMWIFVPQSRAAEGLLPSMAEEAIALHPVRKWHQALRDWWKRRPLYRKANEDSLDPRPTTKKGGVFGFLSRSHNISPNNDPYMGVPIGFLIVTLSHTRLVIANSAAKAAISLFTIPNLRLLGPSRGCGGTQDLAFNKRCAQASLEAFASAK